MHVFPHLTKQKVAIYTPKSLKSNMERNKSQFTFNLIDFPYCKSMAYSNVPLFSKASWSTSGEALVVTH